jgi:hypothetical protein
MTLIVCPYKRADQTDAIEMLSGAVPYPHNELAGPESWRRAIYGSLTLQKLGLRQLSILVEGDLYAEGDDLKELKSEVEQIQSQIETLSIELKIDPKSLGFRLDNILAAIHVASLERNGGVYIG